MLAPARRSHPPPAAADSDGWDEVRGGPGADSPARQLEGASESGSGPDVDADDSETRTAVGLPCCQFAWAVRARAGGPPAAQNCAELLRRRGNGGGLGDPVRARTSSSRIMLCRFDVILSRAAYLFYI